MPSFDDRRKVSPNSYRLMVCCNLRLVIVSLIFILFIFLKFYFLDAKLQFIFLLNKFLSKKYIKIVYF
jgi:hypothetical protein